MLALMLAALPAAADSLRIATWHVDLSRRGPGLLLQELLGEPRAGTRAVVAGLVALDADAVLLTDVDYDAGGRGLDALAALLAAAGADYPHRFALLPNRGMPTGLDLDGDGVAGGPGDAQGFGPYGGWGGMALLSRLPVDRAGVRDFSAFLWADLPGSLLPPDTPPEARQVQRLASSGFWEVPLVLPDGGRLRLLAVHAAPPTDDRNRRRNHDEAAFWLHLLDGTVAPPPAPPFVLLGDLNADPARGEARRAALLSLLSHPAVQDPGTPATADYGGALGALRVDYVLPSAGLAVTGAGVLALEGPRHNPVWVDISLPRGPDDRAEP